MFVLIYLFTVLTAFCQAQSLANDQKPQYHTNLPGNNKQWQYIYQGKRNMNYMQRNRTKPNQQPMGDASVLMKSRIHSMQNIKEKDILMRRGDAGNREGRTPAWSVPSPDRTPAWSVPSPDRTPAWSVPSPKDNLYTGTNVPKPLSGRERPAIAGRGMKIPGLLWPKDMDMPKDIRATVNMDNPRLKLQLNNARRSYNQDIPHNTFEKSEIPTDELRKTLKNIDEQLTKYKNGIYKLFKPHYVRDNPHVEAVKQLDLPIDDKVHTVLKTLKKVRKAAALNAAPEDVSDISI